MVILGLPAPASLHLRGNIFPPGSALSSQQVTSPRCCGSCSTQKPSVKVCSSPLIECCRHLEGASGLQEHKASSREEKV